jgi:hypothetical protein
MATPPSIDLSVDAWYRAVHVPHARVLLEHMLGDRAHDAIFTPRQQDLVLEGQAHIWLNQILTLPAAQQCRLMTRLLVHEQADDTANEGLEEDDAPATADPHQGFRLHHAASRLLARATLPEPANRFLTKTHAAYTMRCQWFFGHAQASACNEPALCAVAIDLGGVGASQRHAQFGLPDVQEEVHLCRSHVALYTHLVSHQHLATLVNTAMRGRIMLVFAGGGHYMVTQQRIIYQPDASPTDAHVPDERYFDTSNSYNLSWRFRPESTEPLSPTSDAPGNIDAWLRQVFSVPTGSLSPRRHTLHVEVVHNVPDELHDVPILTQPCEPGTDESIYGDLLPRPAQRTLLVSSFQLHVREA